MDCSDDVSEWSAAGSQILSTAIANLALKEKMKLESVCSSWRRLLRDDAPPGLWHVVLHGLTCEEQSVQWLNAPLRRGQLQLTRQQAPGFIEWLRHRAAGLESVRFCMQREQDKARLLHWAMCQVDSIQNLSQVEVYFSTRFPFKEHYFAPPCPDDEGTLM